MPMQPLLATTLCPAGPGTRASTHPLHCHLLNDNQTISAMFMK